MEFSLEFSRAWSSRSGLGGVVKASPEDFVVEEILDENFAGEGEHLYLKIRKTGQNTHWVAEQLARLLGVRPGDIGYAGRKDRHAVTTQWFSAPVPAATKDISVIEGCELLKVARHSRKLRPGDHEGNFFRVRITGLLGDSATRNDILSKIASHGFPNYFGLQRFGRDGSNLERGWQALSQRRRLKGRQSGMYLSALRSWIFNQVLDQHLRAGNWRAIYDAEEAWCGPLWGRGRHNAGANEAPVESAVVGEIADLCDYLEHSGLNQERRPLLAQPRSFSILESSDESVVIEFELNTGQFATELLAEIGAEETA